MQLKPAARSVVDVQPQRASTGCLILPFSGGIDRETIEKGAEALFGFVFSSCERLDGKHHWSDCNEETKAGFRAEAAAVLAAVWPGMARPEPTRRSHIADTVSGAQSKPELS